MIQPEIHSLISPIIWPHCHMFKNDWSRISNAMFHSPVRWRFTVIRKVVSIVRPLSYLKVHRKTIEFSNGVNGSIKNYGNTVLQDEITYEAVSNMEYMEWLYQGDTAIESIGFRVSWSIAVNWPPCIPVFSGCSRKCLQTCTVGNGQLEIEKGVDIRANVLGVHLNKDTWAKMPMSSNRNGNRNLSP